MNSLQNNLVPFVPLVPGTNGTNGTNEHRYILASNKIPKLNCPYCGAKKHWQRYFDIETGEALPKYYGKCDNDNKCGQWNDPYKLGYAKMIWEQEQGNRSELPNSWKPKRKKTILQHQPVFFDVETFNQTLEPDRYEKNTFIQNLLKNVKYPFDIMDVGKVILLYKLGAIVTGYRAGAITFPFIDIKDNVRTIQVKQFDENNHTTSTDFLHSIIEKHHTRNNKPLPEWLEAYNKNETKVSCLFGEHLLSKYPHNPVALVEAPKTAIYGTLYFGLPETPESLIWLAVYNKSSFSFDKLKVLKGRFVLVFPDLSKDGSTFKEWETKAKEYESRLPGTRFIFSDLLERLAPEQDKSEGYDLADYLIKQDWRLIRKHNIQEQPPQPEPEKVTKVTHQQNIVAPLPKVEVFKTELHENWNNDIAELQNYFVNIEIPNQPIKLNEYSTITDCSLFIESHFATVKANNGKRTFLPYLNRLKELKKKLIKQTYL